MNWRARNSARGLSQRLVSSPNLSSRLRIKNSRLSGNPPKPKGFGFSDTAFRIFILMASRRLNSDRFFTTDYTPRVYTRAGLDWIDDNDMTSVLLRHFPNLLPALRTSRNAFAPWSRVG